MRRGITAKFIKTASLAAALILCCCPAAMARHRHSSGHSHRSGGSKATGRNCGIRLSTAVSDRLWMSVNAVSYPAKKLKPGASRIHNPIRRRLNGELVVPPPQPEHTAENAGNSPAE